MRHGMPFTAFGQRSTPYNAVGGPTERERVRSVVQTFIKADKASELLPRLVSAENPLPNPPPGDTRWSASDPRFRRDSVIEAAAVNDAGRPSPERLAALLALVYQVRCSLVHGNKNPDRHQDNELVWWGVSVLEEVVPALQDAMS